MENSNKIIPPHLNAEVYRNDTNSVSTISYLDYLRLHPEHGVLVGCSELTGRYWNGGANIFDSLTEARKCNGELKKSIYLFSGTSDGCFIGNSSKVLLCEDSGTVSVWSRSEEDSWSQWNAEVSGAEHDDAALAVDCLQSEKEYVTAGADGNVKVWDINEMLCTRNYISAHSQAVYAVAVRPNTITSFATGSLDQFVSLWEEDTSKPVLDVSKNDCGVRCLQWVDKNKIVYGDEAGVLYLIDVRNPEIKIKLIEFPAAIHKIAVHDESDKLAVCCDNKIVSVVQISENSQSEVIYHDRHMHANSVRGVAWDLKDKNVLHTVGWDGEIKMHTIQQ